METPSHSYGVSLAVWDHTVLPSTRHKWTHPAFTPSRQAGTRFTDHLRVEGWVSPGPGSRCKEQLAHCCYATARSQRGPNPWPSDSPARWPLGYRRASRLESELVAGNCMLELGSGVHHGHVGLVSCGPGKTVAVRQWRSFLSTGRISGL